MTSEQQILNHLLQVKQPTTSKEIAEALKINTHTVRRNLQRLLIHGLIQKADRGKYTAVKVPTLDNITNLPSDTPTKPITAAKTGPTTLLDFIPKTPLFPARPLPPVQRAPPIQRERKKAIYDAILRCILDGDRSPKVIARRMKMKKTTLAYHIKQLKDEGIIARILKSKVSIYEVTEVGATFLEAIHDPKAKVKRITRFEQYRVAFRVLKDNPTYLPVEKGKALVPKGIIRPNATIRTDDQISITKERVYAVTRYHYPKLGYDEIHVHIGPRYGSNTTDVITRSAQEAVMVKQEIERRYGMVLSIPGHVAQPGHFAFDSKIAQLYVEAGGPNVTTMDGWIDGSPPGTKGLSPEVKKLRGEIEYGSPEAAQAFIEAPLMVPELKQRIENLEEIARQGGLPNILETLTEEINRQTQQLDVLEKGGVATQKQVRTLTDAIILLSANMNTLVKVLGIKLQPTPAKQNTLLKYFEENENPPSPSKSPQDHQKG